MKAKKIGAIKFRSARAAARYMLQRYSSWTQTQIARKLRVTIPCVNQVAMELRS